MANLLFCSTEHTNLSYAIYGSTSGYPVIYCHGYPGSHKECPFPEDIVQQNNLRFIVVERPGYGDSTGEFDNQLNNWITAINQISIDQDIDTFAVMGFSGGGFYAQALASSNLLHSKIDKLVLVSSASPLMGQGNFSGIHPAYQELYRLALHDVDALRGALDGLLVDIQTFLEIFLENLPDADKQTIEKNNMAASLKNNFIHAAHNGALGLFNDVLKHVTPWPFDPAKIQCGTQIWHSQSDVNIPVIMCEDLANKIPNNTKHISKDKGHYLYLDYAEEIFNFIKK